MHQRRYEPTKAKNMSKYFVRLCETQWYEVEVESDNEDDACQKALDMKLDSELWEATDEGGIEIEEVMLAKDHQARPMIYVNPVLYVDRAGLNPDKE